MTLRAVRWFVIGIGGLLVILAIVAGVGSRTVTLRKLVIGTLSDRLDSEVELASFSVDTFPTVHVAGAGLVIRHKGRRDVPPLVSIKSFELTGGLIGLAWRPRLFRTVELVGLQINIPPGGLKKGATQADATSSSSLPGRAAILVDRLVADDATLALIPRKVGKSPRVFTIHRLTLHGLGRGEAMAFEAAITNPLPKGLVETKGHFGPWHKDDPGATPLSGDYTFDDVDLSTIKGIAGRLTSKGKFGGSLERIEVTGETNTPDFRLNVSGTPVPLRTTFQAVVDGTDGDTYLNDIAATLAQTAMSVKGAVVGQEGVKGRTVKVHVRIENGRIEDLLRLAIKGEQPVMTGALSLHNDLNLAPGPQDVIDRLDLSGEFEMASARFTNPEVQKRLAEMSARARGSKANGAETVTSNFRGTFTLRDGVLRLPSLAFAMPGASVQVAGTYGLESEALEFDGTLRMQATISEAAGGGVKGALLKVVDPIFRKDGAGAVIPIKVRGTRSDPKFGVDVGKAITPR